MKVITLHQPVNQNELFQHILEKLNPLFQKQRQSNISFIITNTPDGIQIKQPELYDGVLFNIAVHHDQLHITRNENYVDDVNSITLESILNTIFKDESGARGTDLVQEG